MPIRTSDAEWQGSLREGHGHMRFGGGAYDGLPGDAIEARRGDLSGAVETGAGGMGFEGRIVGTAWSGVGPMIPVLFGTMT